MNPRVEELLELAGRAPSVHNTQPWKWRVRGTVIELYADFRRQLMYADQDRRDLFISCGAVLHHLQVAARGLGWSPRVRRLPDPADERLVATVQLRAASASATDLTLLEALQARRTDRRRFTSWPVPDQRLNRLAATGSSWGAQVLPVTSEHTKQRLQHLTRRAGALQQRNPRYVDELAAWVDASPSEGIPAAHIPARAEMAYAADALNRRFPHGTLEDPVLEDEPSQDGMLIVCTSSDDTISRVRAGESLSAVWLAATSDNLAVVPLSQALAVEETRRELRVSVLGDLAFPQILVRVGWPPLNRDPLPPTPRRPVTELLC